MSPSRSLLFSRLSQVSPQQSCPTSLTAFVGSFGAAPRFPCAGGPRAGCRAPCGVSKGEQRGRTPSLDLLASLLWVQPRIWLFFCLCCVRVRPFIHESPQVLLHRAALNEVFSQSVPMSGIALTWGRLPWHLNFLKFVCFPWAHSQVPSG